MVSSSGATCGCAALTTSTPATTRSTRSLALGGNDGVFGLDSPYGRRVRSSSARATRQERKRPGRIQPGSSLARRRFPGAGDPQILFYRKPGLCQTGESSLSRLKPCFYTAITRRARHGDEGRQQCAHETETIESALGRRGAPAGERRAARGSRGLALPGPLGSYFFGPKLVRADVLIKDGGALHLYRVDRGFIRSKANGSLVLRERDGSLVTIAVAPTASITVHGQPAPYSALRKGMAATVIRDGDAPATEVRAGQG